MPAFDSFTPMTLANMRQNGVRSLDVTCRAICATTMPR